jgi:methyl-accepting chemotaxis protein
MFIVIGLIVIAAAAVFFYVTKRDMSAELNRLNAVCGRISAFEEEWAGQVKPALEEAIYKQDDAGNDALSRFEEASKSVGSALENVLVPLNKNLETLTGLMETGRGMTIEHLTAFLDDNFKKMTALCERLEAVSEKMQSSYDTIIALSETQKPDSNALNKQAALLMEMKQSLVRYQEGAYGKELNALETVCDSLDENAAQTFASIDATVKACTEKLSGAFEEFYKLCMVISERTKHEENE